MSAADIAGEQDQDETYWAFIAQKHWSEAVRPVKVRVDVLENEIWDVLVKHSFTYRSLLVLESLQAFEK